MKEPRIEVDGEEVVGCIAEDKSNGEQPALVEAAIEEENRLAEAYSDVERADTDTDTIDEAELEEEDG